MSRKSFWCLTLLTLVLFCSISNNKAEAQLDSASIIDLTKRINERGWGSFSNREKDSILVLLLKTKFSSKLIYDGLKGLSREELELLERDWEKRKLNKKQQPLEKKEPPDTSGDTYNVDVLNSRQKVIRENVFNRHYTEPCIAVSPINQYRFVTGYMEYFDVTYPARVLSSCTSDNGNHWLHSSIPWLTYYAQSDPVIAFDANGVCYCAYIDYQPFTEIEQIKFANQNALVIARSTSGGSIWTDSIHAWHDRNTYPIADFGDKPWIECDKSISQYRNSVYVVYNKQVYGGISTQIRLVRRRESETRFSDPVEISSITPSTSWIVHGPTITVGNDGFVYVFWLKYSSDTSNPVGYMMMNKSTDGGVSFLGETQLSDLGEVYNIENRVLGTYFRRANSFPHVAIRNVGATEEVCLAWADYRQFGTTRQPEIWFSKSPNKGVTWAPPIRINGGGIEQFNPAIATNTSGTTFISYHSRVNTTVNDIQLEVGKSYDGGTTFQIDTDMEGLFFTPELRQFLG